MSATRISVHKINTVVLYPEERLQLGAAMHVSKLIVHLGTPGPLLDVGNHDFKFDDIELIGTGEFRIARSAKPKIGGAS